MILVAGLINIETTLKVEGFPIGYNPVEYNFFGIDTTVSSVGISIPKALNTLGEDTKVISYIGNDISGDIVEKEFDNYGWDKDYLIKELDGTPQSIVLFDGNGKRKIFLDLKNIQDKTIEINKVESLIDGSELVVICNNNFTRSMLKVAKEKNKIIATDVHVLSDVHDEYNKEFLQYADILFLSNENIPYDTKQFICDLKDTYNSKIIVIGLGSEGAMMYVREEDSLYKMDSVKTRDIVNTVGAGDALFSSFVYFYLKGVQPLECLKKAQVFASYKIGENGASNGFISEEKVNALYDTIKFNVDKLF